LKSTRRGRRQRAKAIHDEITGLEEAVKQMQIMRNNVGEQIVGLMSRIDELTKSCQRINVTREERDQHILQLSGMGWRQNRIAAHLHTSQPTVCRVVKEATVGGRVWPQTRKAG
jgi:DNA-binding NarL/FixJ family response regulator